MLKLSQQKNIYPSRKIFISVQKYLFQYKNIDLQTYKEHLEGQKHKKKELTVKKDSKETLPANAYRCELCDVTCTGGDAFAAHLKGSKHQKVYTL